MWGHNEHFPSPVSPFRIPVSPPDVDPDAGGDLVTVTFAREWQAAVLGAMQALTLQSTWRGDEAAVLLAIQRAELLCEIMAKAEGVMAGLPVVTQFSKYMDASEVEGTPVSLTEYPVIWNAVNWSGPYAYIDLDDSEFILQPGVYWIEAQELQRSTNWGFLRLYNNDTPVMLHQGSTSQAGHAYMSTQLQFLVPTTLELRHVWLQAVTQSRPGFPAQGGGVAAQITITRFGDPDV